MNLNVILVGFSGAMGALTRYWLQEWAHSKSDGSFSWVIFFINLSGCLLIGIFSGLLDRGFSHPRALQLIGCVGFLGAYTTFSTFGLEALSLLRDGRVAFAVLYVSASAICGIALVWVGRLLTGT